MSHSQNRAERSGAVLTTGGMAMHSPSARVSIEHGITGVEVYRKNVIVEVRDYDIQACGDNGRNLWTDKNGRKCGRYFVPSDGQRTTARRR